MKRYISAIAMLVFAVFIFTSCGKVQSRDYSEEYHPTTDFQYNLEYDDLGICEMTESNDGFYFIDGQYFYYMEKEALEAIPLCKKADCLHDKETDPYKTATCDAYIGTSADGIFYYNDAVYLKTSDVVQSGETYATKNVLKKYASDGTFLENAYVFPCDPTSLIRHRGCIYFTGKDITTIGEGNTSHAFKLIEVNLETKEEKVLFTDTFIQGVLEKLSAFGKYVYMGRYGYRPENYNLSTGEGYTDQVIVYDLEKDTYEILDSDETRNIGVPTIYEKSMIYSYWHYDFHDRQNRILYQSDLDGRNERELVTLEFDCSRVLWDGSYLYEDNWPLVVNARTDPYRKINVYNAVFEKICTFDFTNVDGMDFDSVDYNLLHSTDDYLFLKTLGPNHQGSYLICVDKDEIASGTVKPRIVFEKEEQYRSIGAITKK